MVAPLTRFALAAVTDPIRSSRVTDFRRSRRQKNARPFQSAHRPSLCTPTAPPQPPPP
jgi:hypothetical protein